MKKVFVGFSAVVVFVLVSMLAPGCQNPNNSSGSPVVTPASGFWKVDFFFDRSDETRHYAGYLFDFQSNGVVIASQGTVNYAGTWRVYSDSGRRKMDLDFAGTHPDRLEELEDDWKVIEMTNTLMHLEDVSGGDGHVETLKFVKQ
ncbi:MAG: hypothetical protein R2879_13535 [Saprospiraceae bacterium]